MSSAKKINNCFLIDDDEDDREIFCDVISRYYSDVKCVTAAGCRDAFDTLKTLPETPDVIFLDLNMPEKNGKQCLTSLKSSNRYKNIPVIIYSTSSQQNDISETKELGAEGYITKQYDLQQLASLLKNVFE